MSAHRYQATYHGITFNQYFPADWDPADPDDPNIVGAGALAAFGESDIRLESVDLTPISTQDLRELRQHGEGANPNEIFEGIRTLILRGHILGANPADLERKTWDMYRAFSPREVRRNSTRAIVGFNPDEPVGVLPFDFSVDDVPSRRDLRVYARPNVGRPLLVGRTREGKVREWAAQLQAYDPTVYSQVQHAQQLVALNGGNNGLANNGNTYVYPSIRIIMDANGASTVVMTNETTGSSMTFDLDSTGSSIIWIRPEQGEMDNGAGISKYLWRKAGFLTNFFLVPGVNVITWSVSTGVNSVWFWWRDAWV